MPFTTRVARSAGAWPLLIVAIAVASVVPAAAADPAQTAPLTFSPYIVNGTLTAAYPTTGALLIYDDASHSNVNSFCSGTLIGCQTFLTAAHCVCPDTADSAPACQRQGINDPSTLRVFLQH